MTRLSYKLIFLLCGLSISTSSFAQLKILPGTQAVLLPQTQLTLHTTDTLFILPAGSCINHGVILLDDSSCISESPWYPVTGNGYEQTTKNFTASGMNANIAGLGMIPQVNITATALTLKRGHADTIQSNGAPAVLRWYSITGSGLPVFPVTLSWDPSEINGNDPVFLKTYSSLSAQPWIYNSFGNSDTALHSIPFTINTDTSVTGLLARKLSADSLSGNEICAGDTLFGSFSASGLFSSSNTFVITISDSSGNFSNSIYTDSLSADGNFSIIVPISASEGTGYLLMISSTDESMSVTPDTIVIHAALSAYFSSLQSDYCITTSGDTLLPLNTGGTFSGNGISGNFFSPSSAGSGIHVITYSIGNAMCVSTYFDTTQVWAMPDAGFSGLDSSYCENEPASTLVPVTTGGNFNGTGVSGNLFDPSSSGTGNFSVTYIVSNGFCTDSSVQTTDVYPLPAVPVIQLMIDSLYTNSSAVSYQWYLNGTILTGETNAYHVAQQNGNYEVEITDSNGCSSVSAIFPLVNLTVNEAYFNNEIYVYPNPVMDIVFIQMNGKETFSAEIVDVSGKVVIPSSVCYGKIFSLDVSSLARGAYIVVLKSGNTSFKKPFMKL
ncbi:MAG: T9SS type A sorting domain-containing protein [Bacteroidota bacterium]